MPKLTHISEMTPDAVVDLDAIFARIDAAWRAAQPQPAKRVRRKAVRAAQGSFPPKGGAPAAVGPKALASDIEAALEAIPNSDRDVDWPRWNHIGMAIYGALGDDGFALFVGWSEKSAKYDAERTGVKWANYQSSPPSRLGAGTLFFEARQYQPNWRKPSDLAMEPPPADGPESRAASTLEEEKPPVETDPEPADEIPGSGEEEPGAFPGGDGETTEEPGAAPSSGDGLDMPAPEEEPPAQPQALGPQPFIIDPEAPLTIARLVLEMLHTKGGNRTLHHHKGVFYGWNGTAYPEEEAAALRTEMYHFLEQCAVIDDKGRLWPYKPNAARVNRVLDALRAEAFLAEGMAAPVWLEQIPDLPPDQIIACENGLLHIPTREVLPHTPVFFTHNALDFAYQQRPAAPFQWLRFLKQLWPDDRQSRRALQEIFGYALTADTSQQKAFLVIGPKRSGKGTIGRVLARLVGIANAAAPTLASLGMNFGLAPLIGKRLAIISDARLGSRADQQIIIERLLSITGEDALTIDRKFLPAWTGRLQTRFLVLTNEIPQIADASGALVSRFVVLILRESFYGREDHHLSNRLLAELPGILYWSLKGLDRLVVRGHFEQPASAAETIEAFEELGSPISAFLREKCVVRAGLQAGVAELFAAWLKWCEQQGRKYPGSAQTFGRDLRAALPWIKIVQPHISPSEGTRRKRLYEGLCLKASWE